MQKERKDITNHLKYEQMFVRAGLFVCVRQLIVIWAATGSKLSPFKDVSTSFFFRSNKKLKNDHVTSLNFWKHKFHSVR